MLSQCATFQFLYCTNKREKLNLHKKVLFAFCYQEVPFFVFGIFELSWKINSKFQMLHRAKFRSMSFFFLEIIEGIFVEEGLQEENYWKI